MDYNEQAKGFCKKYGVTVESKLLYHGPYWGDEKTSRDVYEITIKREGKKDWVFKFGQSIANCGKKPTEYDVLACICKDDPEDFENFCSSYGYIIISELAE